jgi:hypothetical protein
VQSGTSSGCPRTPVRCGGKAAQCRACLPATSTPDVPFCAVVRMATIVVLARRSAPERVRLAAPTISAAEGGFVCPSGGAGGLPRLLLFLRPERHFRACGQPRPEFGVSMQAPGWDMSVDDWRLPCSMSSSQGRWGSLIQAMKPGDLR